MTGKAPVFNKIIKDYLLQVTLIEAKEEVGASLGITVVDDGFKVPFFRRNYAVTTDRIVDADGISASHVVSVILCKYLLLCPTRPLDDFSLVTYKDFMDAAPYVGGFRNTAEQPIARYFEGALLQLEKRCQAQGGHFFDTEVSCQLAMRFQALPNIPIFLLFNDADEDFPAQATLLFQKNASSYLDTECLAMIGATLAYRLQEN
jgi:hypothetical protein